MLNSKLRYCSLSGQECDLSSVWLIGSVATQLEMLLTCYVKSKHFEVTWNQIPSEEDEVSSEFTPLRLIKPAELCLNATESGARV
ncbi:hypothetical protein JOB18_024373 [Solea senegalensis]|uniref:Leptin receptor n=1 Tax=Solea senegalensis TaxID=28829 RepID=A0AAV6QWL8_SOLSE|nr:hypothetical protein JOB18_024373 [Solea senegalensis]